MTMKNDSTPQVSAGAPSPGVGSSDLFGVPYLVDNLREWAAEFRSAQHPVTLTLFRAIQTLEKMDAAMTKADREKAHLHAEIGRYRAAIDDFCQLYDEGLGGDSKYLENLRAVLAPQTPKILAVPVWQKYGHPSEVIWPSPNKVDNNPGRA
jgi:hypothetical protein